ncbi:MAG: N-acetyl-gamma-glutamyl-phosphate reductase [Alphaproteobacteria bacterium]
MVSTVFIDGEVGTTGLQIHARLKDRSDIKLLHLSESERKDSARRREALNDADLSILCLPDPAAREAVALVDNPNARLIDASTAHRVADDWIFGFSEHSEKQRAAIAAARRVSNPGCYAVTSIAMLHPLVSSGILAADTPITINAVSGYSGGGKGMIASYEDSTAANYTTAPFNVYGLTLEHKHVPEIQRYSGLTKRPLFVPSVGRYRQGMIVQVPLQLWALANRPTPSDIHRTLTAHYAGCRFVSVVPLAESAKMTGLEPEGLNDTNLLRLHVFGNEGCEQAVVMGLIDNLGKGASGMAVQNMNIMLGLPEDTGLV